MTDTVQRQTIDVDDAARTISKLERERDEYKKLVRLSRKKTSG